MSAQSKIAGEITQVKIIAAGKDFREVRRLRKFYGHVRWSKLKGVGAMQLPDGTIRRAEQHWYEGAAIGKKELKIKRLLD